MTSVVDAEIYRPARHFSPKRGWMNDPNGLIRVDGLWHAFFQFYPDGTTHGPMHWGHATTPDLVTWTEQPIALYPDSNGTCFSGSAIQTAAGDVELFYTAHRVDANGEDLQTQCVARGSSDLLDFVKDPLNPIIPNPGLRAFRDPKVVWHALTQRWIMVLTHGQSIGFYSSPNRRHWSLESTFGEGHGRHSTGPWECPDLIEMLGPDGKTRWVLIVGIGDGAFAGGSGTQYFVGDFDGRRFENANAPDVSLWLDHGRDYYAAQSFSGAGDRPPTLLAWASNWQYARQTPTRNFRGSFALPRELRLLETGVGLRLAAEIPAGVAEHFDELRLVDDSAVPQSGTYRLSLPLAGSQSLSVALFSESVPQIEIQRPINGPPMMRLRRSSPHEMVGFDHDYLVPLTLTSDPSTLEIFVDNGLVEVCMDGGLVWATSLNFPANPAGRVRLSTS